jgi:hypothetical protein
MRALARGDENKPATEYKFVSDYSLLFDTVVVNYLSAVNSFDN